MCYCHGDFKDGFKMLSKTETVVFVLFAILLGLVLWMVLLLRDIYPVFKKVLELHSDIPALIVVSGVAIIVLLALWIGLIYRKNIRKAHIFSTF